MLGMGHGTGKGTLDAFKKFSGGGGEWLKSNMVPRGIRQDNEHDNF